VAKSATTSKSKKGAAPLAALTEKPVTQRYENLAAYIEEQTGYHVEDVLAIQLAVTLYGKFQKSDVNRAYLDSLASKREERLAAREQRAADREARAAARAEKAANKKAAPAKKATAKKAATKKAASNVTELMPKVAKKPAKKTAKKATKSAAAPF
jgi:hypothetical protein